ncbi:hypothetical protein Pst134EA_002498 [Puccinia striiformis f. sp. tritici]|uniref:uncharacterized protein n=1 Tax=Puccinia striiformis f. sp. tritici TaxID=168172 RepID=UPI002008596D|nr:uncharacterized protein Pst134EA_032906 [Puccinia striiformis f. sp. tritici]XP_047811320.1 hypothetical protein Pst134EA_002498 [Puccinia striiformis f. sp. tritici]KAH9441545.1 hypothetical protein Pst134EA_032906 [Puccinia striiformis f. sp. tritici]KAH9471866.1 hypothetical protein Pst134EA_002498 [Puccinia striiformis f. sp. tritici]
MKWCNEPTNSLSKLREIYLSLDQREVEREEKTMKLHDDQHPYTAMVSQMPVNKLKNRSVFFLSTLCPSCSHSMLILFYSLLVLLFSCFTNRCSYGNIYPYDPTRLLLVNPIQGNDYINASWIYEPAFETPSALLNRLANHHLLPPTQTWIAAQGPLPETCYEFLSLFLDRDATRRPRVLIQLTGWREGGRDKCARYIPEEVGDTLEFRAHRPLHVGTSTKNPGQEKFRWSSLEPAEKLHHGHLRVTLESSQAGPIQLPSGAGHGKSSTIFYRKNILLLELVYSDQDQQPKYRPLLPQARVIHYQCIDWPDRGIPSSVEPILELIDSATTDSIIDINPENPTPTRSPILVHCSAGVGRTGTLIAIASCTARLKLLHSLCHPTDQTHQSIITHLIPTQPVIERPGRLPVLPDELNGDLVAHTVDFLREQRLCMVQTEGQLGFVYRAVAHSYKSLSS